MDDTEFLNLVLADMEPEDGETDEDAVRVVPEALAAEPVRWRDALAGMLGEAMADISAKNVEIQDCTTARRGYPKLIRLKEERTVLVDRQVAISARVRIAKQLVRDKWEQENRARDAAKAIRARRPKADPDGSEMEQIRAHLSAVFRLLEVIEGEPVEAAS